MPRLNNKNSSEDALLSFCTTNNNAKFVREKLVEEPNKYFTTTKCLKKPAEVMDKLRKAHARLLVYNQDSMKGRISRIIKEDDICEDVVQFFEKGVASSVASKAGKDEDEDDDEIVSENE